jgi:hypothetical protein
LQEDVLGLPLTFTVNPASQRVDYIQAHPYLLSVTAFKAGVRRTPERVSDQCLDSYLNFKFQNNSWSKSPADWSLLGNSCL